MDTTATTNNFAKPGQSAAEKATDKIQGGIRDAQRTVNQVGDQLSNKAEEVRDDVAPVIKKVADQTQAFARQSMKTVSDASRQIADSATQVSDSVISYTKTNPVKAILIAAASGALLLTVIRALTPSRD